MTVWTYLAMSASWSALGLLAGFFMGRSTVAVDAIVEAVLDEGEPMSDPTPARRPRFSATHAIGAVVIVLGVFTAVQSYVQADTTNRLAECQAAYSNGFADALDARSAATAEAQDALDDLLTSVSLITPTREGRQQFRDALTEYLDKRAAAKEAHAENPYPPAPRDVCKEAG